MFVLCLTPYYVILWGKEVMNASKNDYGNIPFMEWLTSISGGVLYKLSTVQANIDYIFNVSKPSHLSCRLCLYGSTVTVYRQSLDTFDSARCEDLVVTSSEDIIPGVAGKLVGPGSEQTNTRVWWRTGRPPFTNQLVRLPTWEAGLRHCAPQGSGPGELGSLQLR